MVKSTDLWNLNDPVRLVRLNGSTFWRVLIQRQVRTGLVIIAEIIFEQSTQMVVIEDDHIIQKLATNASNHPLHVAILPRTPWCNANLLDSHSLHSGSEGFTVDSVTVSNHKPRSPVFRKCFNDLLCSPNRRRMFRDVEVDDATAIVRQDDEDIQHSETNRCDCEEIDRYQLPNMVSKKRHPSLGGLPISRHQSRDRSLGNVESEFQQLTVDAWGS